MPQVSAGLVMYRRLMGAIEVLLVHPGGPFWKNKDLGAWSIPKGKVEEGEDLLETARREFLEEVGCAVEGKFVPLKPVRQKSGKIVHAWAVEGSIDTGKCESNAFQMEYPPKSGKFVMFPEVDRVEYFDLAAARKRILGAQAAFLVELEALFK